VSAAAATLPTGGKDHRTENFPVASLLLAPAARGPVLAFYRFVRAADDVADAPGLAPGEKLRRLAEMEAAAPADAPEALLLLDAFRQDATKRRYADWDELLAYCRRSADPVGRFLLRLHGEGPAAHAPADALCTALQILNHLQDLAPDRERLDRVYLPLPWLERAGGEERFFDPAAAAARRPVLDAALDHADGLLAVAEALPGRLRDRRLAAQAAATLACGRALSRRLRRRDPILRRVSVRPPEVALAVAAAAAGVRGRADEAVARAILRRSGSSFRLGIASLRGERRRAMQALYAFCRTVDDLADSAAPPAERGRFLERWRGELEAGEPRTPVGRELAWACRRFDLPRSELHLLVDGMAADAADRVRLADEAGLEGYCRAVAGTVGVLSVRIFGAAGADGFALRLARALQLTNILRDVEEDAARDRVYLPAARLAALGIGADAPAAEIVAHGRFGEAWARLAEDAAAAFAAADEALAGLDRRPLKPALLMLWSYRPLLERLRASGWRAGAPRVRLGRAAKLRLAWRALRDVG
jgi:hydroxysqualene synthase